MAVVGIISEYNPFHNGHRKQFRIIREMLGEDTDVICLMSGNYVQRGEPALFSKFSRSEAAVRCGADLVLELPVTYSLRSAEGFACGGIDLLDRTGVCDYICFGTEDPEKIHEFADVMSGENYTLALKKHLESGLSYPAAREAALNGFTDGSNILSKPNNILGVEYCLALKKLKSGIKPLPIKRMGSYHEGMSDCENPSAEYIRNHSVMEGYVPDEVLHLLENCEKHSIATGEKAMLAVLRSLKSEDLQLLPFSSEGLWNKIYKEIRKGSNLEEIITGAKSKRYPYTRISRMLMCAYLGITQEELQEDVPWIKVLGFDRKGRTLLKKITESGMVSVIHPGEKVRTCWYSDLYDRAELLYDLFAENTIGKPRERVFSKD